MDCRVISVELTGYHFGTLTSDERNKVETHLSACSVCLKEFIKLKRSIELGQEDETADVQPSERARLALRAAVAKKFSNQKPAAEKFGFLNIRIPLYQVAAVMTLVILVVLIRDLTLHRNSDLSSAPHENNPATSFDGSNLTPKSSIYL